MIGDKDYKALCVLCIALMTVIIFFGLISIAVYFTTGAFIRDANIGNWIFLVGVFVSAIGIATQRYMYEVKMRKLQIEIMTDKKKLDKFRSILITHIAVCEAFAIAGIMCFIFFRQWLFFLFVGMSLVEIAKKFPLRSKVDSIINSSYL